MIRPKITDEDVIALALDALLPRVMEWLSRSSGDYFPEGEIREELRPHIHCGDGFDFCFRLKEQNYWECDSELVDILDGAPHEIYKALSQQAKKWIAAYQIFPSRAVGDTVQFGQHSCEITKVDNEEGRYWLFSPEEGHVREGLGTHAHIVDWEKIDGRVNARGLTITGPLLDAHA